METLEKVYKCINCRYEQQISKDDLHPISRTTYPHCQKPLMIVHNSKDPLKKWNKLLDQWSGSGTSYPIIKILYNLYSYTHNILLPLIVYYSYIRIIQKKN